MSKRREIEARLESLNDIREIMNAMKNLALMEVNKLARFLDKQRRVVAGIEAAAADFLHWHPELMPDPGECRDVTLLLGSERGFCGDFNETLLRKLDARPATVPERTVILVGAKLAAKAGGGGQIGAVLRGASVVEEVDAVLLKLMDTLAVLKLPGRASAAPRLTLVHHRPEETEVRVTILQPFPPAAKAKSRFRQPPRLYLQPRDFLTALAEQYLFAMLHQLIYSSLMAENQRRMQHMEGAVRRLERISTELSLKRNILRQEEITEEIEVIMLSVEAFG